MGSKDNHKIEKSKDNLEKPSKVKEGVSLSELEYLAFHDQFDTVYDLFRAIPSENQKEYLSKYVLRGIIQSAVKRLRKIHVRAARENFKSEEQGQIKYLDEIINLFISQYEIGSHPKELFDSILLLSTELVKINYIEDALEYYRKATELKITRFSELFSQLLLEQGRIFNATGQLNEADKILSSLMEKSFLLSNYKLKAEIIWELSKVKLLNGDIRCYKQLIWQGLSSFYTDIKIRMLFTDQVITMYRYPHKLILSSEVSIERKLLFLPHCLYFKTYKRRIFKLLRIENLFRFILLGYVYFNKYRKVSESVSTRITTNFKETVKNKIGVSRSLKNGNILITRAMGGVGDLLMMTPGFHALKQKYPDNEIHLAVPRGFFSLFDGNDDVILKDITSVNLDTDSYYQWFNLTDCPAARIESRTMPDVKKSRIDIFASALGLSKWQLHKMNRKIRYFVSKEEQEFQKQFWHDNGLEGKTVIGIHLYSVDTYKNYPYMEQLVQELLKKEVKILLFHSETINGYELENVIKVDSYPLRQAFALARGCNAFVAPDSVFVHFTGACEIPCIALYGPTDGKLFTKYYKSCRLLDVRDITQCVPCWRNEYIPCKLTGTRTSACMKNIKVSRIANMLEDILSSNNALL